MRKHVTLRTIFLFAAVTLFSLGVTGVSQGKDTAAAKGRKPGPHGLHSPIRLAFGADGNLLVSDYRLGMIVTVDRKSNQTLRWFAVEGRPLGVAYHKGHIYVGNETAQRIDIFNFVGKTFKKKGAFKTAVGKPTDIAVDRETDRIFVVDGIDRVVKVFDTKGKLTGLIPASDPGHTILTAPTAVAVDAGRQEVLVSDYGDKANNISPRIQVFDYNGNCVDTITSVVSSGGGMGMGGWNKKPRFSKPQGLAVDGAGHIFMLDCFSSEILVFDRDSGDLIKTIGGFGTDPGQMRLPLDIVLQTKTKDLFVTDNRDACIEVFEKGGVL